jgi:hypothetical protein
MDDNGNGLAYMLRQAKSIAPEADGTNAFIWINSYNEWWETTSLEKSQNTPNISCNAPNNCYRYAWKDGQLNAVKKVFSQPSDNTPSITSIQRSVFGTNEKASFTISGSNFKTSSWVTFLPLGASSVTYNSASSLTAKTPVYEGQYTDTAVAVANPDGQTSNIKLVKFVPLQLEWNSSPAVCPNSDLGINVAAVNVLEESSAEDYYYIDSATLTINPSSACFTLVGGNQSQTLINIMPYSNKSATWTVHSSSNTGCSPKTITISVSNVKYCYREPDMPDICYMDWTPSDLVETVSIKNPSFSDVSCNNMFFGYIERIYEKGITAGCATNPLRYCPSDPITREGMAKFITVARGNTDVLENPCIPQFTDVSSGSPFCSYIENIKNEGLVMGSCDSSPWHFCPSSNTLRIDMGIWTVLGIDRRAGLTYHGFFTDIGGYDLYKRELIEKGNVLGIYDGCSTGHYCPTNNVTREQMAKFMVNAWDL